MKEDHTIDAQQMQRFQANPADLIAHIIDHYHNVHRQQLPALIALSRKVERVHEEHPACPAGLADALEQLYQELESHMVKEEQVLFPMLVNGMAAQARGPVSIMRLEHRDQEVALQALNTITAQGLPADACGSWRNLYATLDAFRTDLQQHIHLENDVLFSSVSQVAQGAHHA